MKIKYTGPDDEITLRHVTFQKGKPVVLDMTDEADASLAEKALALDIFAKVRGRKHGNAG